MLQERNGGIGSIGTNHRTKRCSRTPFPRPDERQLNLPHILCLPEHQSVSVSPVRFPNIVGHASCFWHVRWFQIFSIYYNQCRPEICNQYLRLTQFLQLDNLTAFWPSDMWLLCPTVATTYTKNIHKSVFLKFGVSSEQSFGDPKDVITGFNGLCLAGAW